MDYRVGLEQVKTDDRMALAKMVYTRVCFKNECGDTETSRGTVNPVLILRS